MACHELFTRARAKIAASRIAIKVSVALGIMSGYALALKGLKRAANDENGSSDTGGFPSSLAAPETPDYLADTDNEFDQMLQGGSGLDAFPTPPLPNDGARTRYSPPGKKHKGQDLLPKPLKIRDTNSPDKKDRETSILDMLKTNPLEEISPLKEKTATSAASPTIENEKHLEGGRETDTRPRIRINAHATGSKPLGFRESNSTAAVGNGNIEMPLLGRAMTDPFEETNPTKDNAKISPIVPTVTTKIWSPFASHREQMARFHLDQARNRELANKELANESSSAGLDAMRGSNEKEDEFSLRALAKTDPAYEKQAVSPSDTRFQAGSSLATLRRKVSSAFSKESSDLTMTLNESPHSILSQSKSSERKRLLASIKEAPDTNQSVPPKGRKVLYDADASKLSGRYEFDTPEEDTNPWSTTPAKRTTRKNVLTVDTIKASIKAGVSSHKSPNLKKANPLKLAAGSEPKSMYRLPGAPVPIYPQGGPSVFTDGHTKAQRSGGSYLQDVFGVGSTNDLHHSDSSRTVWSETDPEEEMKEEAEEVGKVFFFEEFHGENVAKIQAGKGTEQSSGQSSSERVINNDEVKDEAKAMSDDDSEYSSEQSTIKGVSAICQDLSDAISEMDEATRHEQSTRKDAAARKEADARQTKEHKDIKACKVDELRKKTGTEVVLYAENDLRPKHPNHGRKWNAKNLFCTTCKGLCAICNAPCCALRKALESMAAIQDGANLTSQEDEMCRLASSIDSWIGEYGVDEPTFMRCTQCFNFICPDCCSQCPVYPCHDCMCRKCNLEGQWKCCKYHDKTDIPDHIEPYQRFQHQRK